MSNETTSAQLFLTVTPSDSTVLPANVRALYVGTGGTLVVTDQAGTDATFSNVPTGALLPIRATKVKATGTTASTIIALR